jgi:DNA-binding GntR family transcriptional regulator
MPVTFTPVRTATLKESILEVLVDAVISGKLKPGDRLNESELSRQLGVSRAPIREALQQLQEQGLVENQPRRGMFVVNLEQEGAQKINSLRLILEPEALDLCRLHRTPEGEKRLQDLVARMDQRSAMTAIEATRLDLDFHRTIWSQTGNEYLEKTLTSLTAPLFAYATLTKPKQEKMRMILDSHRPLLDYILTKRPRKTAHQVIREHLELRWDDPGRYCSESQASPH